MTRENDAEMWDELDKPIDRLAHYEDDTTRVDTEDFIHSLPYENTLVLLFVFMGFKVKEISPEFNLSSSEVYRLLVDNKKRAIKRYNLSI